MQKFHFATNTMLQTTREDFMKLLKIMKNLEGNYMRGHRLTDSSCSQKILFSISPSMSLSVQKSNFATMAH